MKEQDSPDKQWGERTFFLQWAISEAPEKSGRKTNQKPRTKFKHPCPKKTVFSYGLQVIFWRADVIFDYSHCINVDQNRTCWQPPQTLHGPWRRSRNRHSRVKYQKTLLIFAISLAHPDTRYIHAELSVCLSKVILNKKTLLVHFRSIIKMCSSMLILLPSKRMADDSSESHKKEKQRKNEEIMAGCWLLHTVHKWQCISTNSVPLFYLQLIQSIPKSILGITIVMYRWQSVVPAF